MELAQNVEALIGAVIAAMTLAGLLVRFVWSRVTARVDSGVSGLKVGHQNIEKRLKAVEEGQAKADRELLRIDRKVSSIEGRLQQLASKQDISELAIKVAEISATGRATAGMVDSLHKGLLALAERSKQ